LAQSPGEQSTEAGAAGQQEHEAAGHSASAVRKQGGGCWRPAVLPFIQSRTLSPRIAPPTFRIGLHLAQPRNSQTRPEVYLLGDSVMSTINSNHHMVQIKAYIWLLKLYVVFLTNAETLQELHLLGGSGGGGWGGGGVGGNSSMELSDPPFSPQLPVPEELLLLGCKAQPIILC
jgi:hypothetical protein